MPETAARELPEAAPVDTTHQAVASPIPLPPPPPETDDEGATKATKVVVASPPPPAIVKGEKKTVEINGQQVPSALVSAFAQSTGKDKQPFAYIQGGVALKPDQTRPSEVRREERKERSQSRGPSVPKVLPIVIPLESDTESVSQTASVKQQPDYQPYHPEAASKQNYTSSLTSQTPPSVTNQQAFEFEPRSTTYRPIAFIPDSPTQSNRAPTSLSSIAENQTFTSPPASQQVQQQHLQSYESPPFAMPTIQHLQYNTPINMYSAASAQQAFEQTTGQPAQATGPREFNPDRSATYRTLLEVEGDRQTGGRPLTPHSARMEEQPGDVYAGRYHGYVNAQAQSPSFRRLQAVANAGEYSEAGNAVREYEARALSSAQSHQDPRALSQTPSAAAAPPSERAHTPRIVEYARGVEERPVDYDLASKIAEAERPKVPPPVTPVWAHHAADKQNKWSAAHGYDPRAQSEQRRFLPEQPHWQHGFDYSRQVEDHLQAGHQGRVFDGPNRQMRSVTPSSANVRQRTDMGGTDYGYYGSSRFDRARSLDPSHHYGTAPPRYVHKYRSAAEREWLKPYVAPNLRGDRWSENYGALISNQDNVVNRQNHTSRQDLTQLGTYYGPPAHARGGYQGAMSHQYSSNYQQFAPQTQSLSRASVPISYTPMQQSSEQHSYQSMQQETHQRSLTPRPVSTGLSPRQKEMGTSFLEGNTTMPQLGPGAQPTWRSASRSPSRGAQGQYTTGSQGQYNTGSQSSHQYQSQQQQYRASSVRESSQTPANVTYTPSRAASTLPPSSISNWHTAAGNNWTITTGANSKATTSGDYIDADGNKVHYTKQYQTTNDPAGKGEYSLLTEEERKVMEEPLQPGVISRHVTTKYYKKSTYANQQTTTTSVPANKPLAITTGDNVKTGQVTPGLTQF